MTEGLNKCGSVAHWTLLVSEDNKEAREALKALKAKRKGKKYQLIEVNDIVPTWIEREVK